MRQQRTFQDRNKYPGPEDLPVPPPVIAKPVQHKATAMVSETEIIRLLMKYGSTEYERHISEEDGAEVVTMVSDYIVNDIAADDLKFDDPVLSAIFGEFHFAVSQGTFIEEMHFVKHSDPVISKLAADLLSEPHQLSRIFANKQTYVETEDMRLKEMVPDSLLKFKSDKILMRLADIMTQMKEAQQAGDNERIMTLMKKDQNLKAALITISEKLGRRIIL
jgi:DNA primase